MDSVTQFVLGAGVASLTLGPKLGWRAVVTGGLIATLPDLDTFIHYSSRLDAVTYHRGFSHSLIVQTLVSPLIAFGVFRLFRSKFHLSWRRILLTVWLCLITHSLLDGLTTYGTQLFWPLNVGSPIALPSVFIIDPVYTLLLLIGVLLFWFFSQRNPTRATTLVRCFMGLATVYLGLGLSAHMIIKARATALPQLSGMRIHVQPTPFNILYWQVLAVDDHKTLMGVTSVLHSCSLIDFKNMKRNDRVSPKLSDNLAEDVKRFEWFTGGFFSYNEQDNGITITDLRIGFGSSFPFSYEIASRRDGVMVPHAAQRVQQPRRGLAQLKQLYQLASLAPHGCW